MSNILVIPQEPKPAVKTRELRKSVKPIITCDIDGVITKQPKWVRFVLWLMGKVRTPHLLKVRIIRQINLKYSKLHNINIVWLRLLSKKYDIVFVSSRDISYTENTKKILAESFGRVYPYYLCDKREAKRDKIHEISPIFHIDDLEFFCKSLKVPYIVVR